MPKIERFKLEKPQLIGFGLVMLFIIVVGFIIWRYNQSPISDNIRNQINTTIFEPSTHDIRVERKTVKYDKDLKLLSYNATKNGNLLTFSEQPSPDQFTDIPDAYPKLIIGLGQYDQFENSLGKIYLVRSSKLNEKEVAVTNSKGTLLFIKSQKDIDQNEWREIFKNLKY